jgi:DNA-binding NarL/FixJ family response regulator
MDLLTYLVDQSLVAVDTSSEHERFPLLETVREFAAEQLQATEEVASIQMRHAQFFAALAQTAEPQLTGQGQTTWLATLDQEQANLEAALQTLRTDPHQLDTVLLLGNALARFWWIKNRLITGRTVLEQIVMQAQASAAPPSSALATLLHWAATMAWGQADYLIAQQHYSECLAICRAINDAQATAHALKGLGTFAREQGRTAEARRLFEEGLALMRAANDTWGVTLIISHLGMTLESLGEYAAAHALQSECLALSHELGDTWSVAYALKDLAQLALHAGDPTLAMQQVGEAIQLFTQLDDTQGMAYALLVQGDSALLAGDPAAAQRHFQQMHTILSELGDRRGVALAECGLADVALARQDLAAAHQHLVACLVDQHAQRNPVTLPRGIEIAARLAVATADDERAVWLFAAAEQIRASMGVVLPQALSGTYTQARTQLAQRFSGAAFATAWKHGTQLSLVEAIALAQRPLLPPKITATAPTMDKLTPTSASDQLVALTPRERDVLALLVQGLPNGEIAAHLHMSPHTVHSHVRSIFSKFGVNTRAAATRVALERGLVVQG